MTTEEFLAMAVEVQRRWPGATLVKNEVGNLAIMYGQVYVGYLDLGLMWPGATPEERVSDV